MLWFFFTAALASTTISAPSSQDAAVAKWDADRRFGGETAARLTKGAYSGAQIGSPNAASTTFLVQFDLPLTIGESMGSVESAAVRFTLAGDIEPGVKLRAYRLTEGFDDDPTSGVNWATRPAADSTPAVMWTSAGASAGDTIEVDVSALLAQNGAMPTFGLVFELASPWEHSTDTLHTYAFAYAREDGVGAPAHLSAEVAIRTGGWTDDLSAGGDAQINQRDVNSGVNYGAADQVWMSSHADATYEGPAHPSEFMNVGLIDFPLVGAHDAVYADAESAMLNLHAAGELPEGTAIVIRLLDAPFDEGSVTWNSRPTRLSVPTATWIAPAGGVQAGEPFQVDVLELVLANPQSNNFGLQLERYDGAGYVWATKESMSWPGPTLRVSTEPTFDAYIDHPSGLVQRGTPLSLEVELDGLCPEDEAERIRVMAIDELGLVRGTGSLPVGPISWPSDPQTGLPTCPEGGESVRRSVALPTTRRGVYRVRVDLGGRRDVAAAGSRPEGWVSFAVVSDPQARPSTSSIPPEQAFFGVQGGWTDPSIDYWALMGFRWTIASPAYQWSALEGGCAQPASDWSPLVPLLDWPTTPSGTSWDVYELPTLYDISNEFTGGSTCAFWGIDETTLGTAPSEWRDYSTTAQLNEVGRIEWPRFAAEAATEFAAQHPGGERLYQITWEPDPPFNYQGSPAGLVEIHELGHDVITGQQPEATVISPTYTPLHWKDPSQWPSSWDAACDDYWSAVDPTRLTLFDAGAWHFPMSFLEEPLFCAGLGDHIDGFSHHPYTDPPLDDLQLLDGIRGIAAGIEQYVPSGLPLYATEFGFLTSEVRAGALDRHHDELQAARDLIRQNLILLGEGWQMALSFAPHDYTFEFERDGVLPWGMFYNHDSRVGRKPDVVSPKPVVPAYATMTEMLEGFGTSGTVAAGLSPDQLGYVFTSLTEPDTQVIALWSRTAVTCPCETATLALGSEASLPEVVDWMGRRIPLTGYTLRLVGGYLYLDIEVSQAPVYVSVRHADVGALTQP